MIEQDRPLVGESISTLDTPVIIVDLDILESNLSKMATYFEGRQCQLRPHFKSHKCVELARRQLAFGNACGITCAKLSEAEQLVAGGILDILIANQVVGSRKAIRLAQLNRLATVRCAVDSLQSLEHLDQAARKVGSSIPVLIEVDIGMKRCGVEPGEASVALAKAIDGYQHLRFDGLQGYEGHLVNIVDLAVRREKTIEAMRPLVETRRMIEHAGLAVSLVSGGSSSTYDITGCIDGIDECQCGSYALMDWTYQILRPEFEIARWVLSTVISSHPNCVVLDVGLKGVGCDFGPPKVKDLSKVSARYTAEEHIPLDNLEGKVGDLVKLIPSHGCTTNSLYRKMWVVRNDVVIDVWEIEGAGCLE